MVPPTTLWMASASFVRLRPTVSISIPNRSVFIVVVLAFCAGPSARRVRTYRLPFAPPARPNRLISHVFSGVWNSCEVPRRWGVGGGCRPADAPPIPPRSRARGARVREERGRVSRAEMREVVADGPPEELHAVLDALRAPGLVHLVGDVRLEDRKSTRLNS